ncbi:MAG: TerC family protein [Bryobacterales bacterium]|nr:TerC family protein [Bryobacterales bacterium]
MTMPLFPFAEYWWFYGAFTLFVLLLLLLDLGVFHRKAHAVSLKEAGTWSVVWIGLALLFNLFLYYFSLDRFGHNQAREVSLEFLAGYVVEKSLSVDNIFIFVLVFRYFRVPQEFQHRILFYGVLGALVFRAIFIALGTWLLQFHWILLLFGAFLIVTGLRMMIGTNETVDPEKNPVVKLFRRVFPITDRPEGAKFFLKREGRWYATPLALVLVFLETSDLIFAIDSVPAIFALTSEPLIVYTSNVFAILGLRSLYFVLAGVVERFHLLHYGLAAVLIFVGLKMVWLDQLFGGKFPIVWSLAIIGVLIGGTVALSLLYPKAPELNGEALEQE